MLDRLLERYKTPEAMQCASQVDILRYFNTWGMQGRAARLKQLADSYTRCPPKAGVVTHWDPQFVPIGVESGSEVGHLRGLIGYDNQAWKVFCRDALYGREWDDEEAQWRDFRPADPRSRDYIAWLLKKEREMKFKEEINQEIKQEIKQETR